MTTAAATPLDLLEDARQLVERAFTMGALARDAMDNMIDNPCDRRACAWCSTGALCHVAGARDYHQLVAGDSPAGEAGKRAMQLLEEAARDLHAHRPEFERTPADVNDYGGRERSLGMYDDAIRAARIEQEQAA